MTLPTAKREAAVRAREAVRLALVERDRLRRHCDPQDGPPHPLHGTPLPPLSLDAQRKHLDALDARLCDADEALRAVLDLPHVGAPTRYYPVPEEPR